MNICIAIILAIWLVTVIITSPYAYYMTLVQSEGSASGKDGNEQAEVEPPPKATVLYCDEQWPGDSVRLSYTVLTSILQFVVPLLIIGRHLYLFSFIFTFQMHHHHHHLSNLFVVVVNNERQ